MAFGAKAGSAAGEIARGYADDGVGMAIDLNCFADDLRVSGEMVLPDGVPDDDNGSDDRVEQLAAAIRIGRRQDILNQPPDRGARLLH